MRAVLRPLSTHTVFSPIETIISVFVLATLAYFHILSGIKHSSFFASSHPPALRPAFARLSDGEWVAVSQHDWTEAWKHPGGNLDALELQQVVFTLDDKTQPVSSNVSLRYHFIAFPPRVFHTTKFHAFTRASQHGAHMATSLSAGADTDSYQTALLDASAISQHLVSNVPALSGKAYSSICHHPNVSGTSCFTSVSGPGSSPILTLSFKPGTRDDWLGSLRKEKTITLDGVKYSIDAGKRQESIGEMQSSKWVAYAVSALVLRFWELTKVRGLLLLRSIARPELLNRKRTRLIYSSS